MESLNDFKATELRLGLPGRDEAHNHQEIVSSNKNKRSLSGHGQLVNEGESTSNFDAKNVENEAAPPSKVQIVGWPPVRSYRKNSFKKTEVGTPNTTSGMYIKVSMDGAPYLRKIDLTLYKGYPELLKALENMFKLNIGEYTEREGYKGSEYAPAYEDKDGDLMLVGDVPWDMFISSCKKLRIIKGSDAKGLAFGV